MLNTRDLNEVTKCTSEDAFDTHENLNKASARISESIDKDVRQFHAKRKRGF